jgi:ATP-dependent protease ClpP protease subunit
MGNRASWYEIRNQEDGSSDLYIFNEIGLGGITAEAFMTDLRGVTARKINLHLNSPGGDVFDGIAIHNTLKQHPAEITVMVDALAASIASVIAMAGDKIVMARHSSMMIHEAHGMAVGDAEDMVMMADRLNVISEQIASIYKERVPGSKQVTWRNRMKAETWYTEEEAVRAGLADEVGAKAAVTNLMGLPSDGSASMAAFQRVAREIHYINEVRGIATSEHAAWLVEQGVLTEEDAAFWIHLRTRLDKFVALREPDDPSNPYPNEHACRLREPDDFQPNSFRRTSRDHDGKPYDVIAGKLEGEDTMTEQAYRYPKDDWDAGDARKHCDSHDGSFEAASERKTSEDKAPEDNTILEAVQGGISDVVKRQRLPEYDFASVVKQAMKEGE